MDGKINVVCCFCGKELEIQDSVSLIIYPLFGSDESQELFCHRKHLVENIDKSIPLHPDLEEDDV